MTPGRTAAGTAYIFDAALRAICFNAQQPHAGRRRRLWLFVGISGHTVVVGAPYDVVGARNAGSVSVFDAPTGDLVRTINNPARGDRLNPVRLLGCGLRRGRRGASCPRRTRFQYHDRGPYWSWYPPGSLGRSATSGNIVAVGDIGSRNALLFDLESGTLLRTIPSPLSTYEDFPGSMALSGTTLIVGTSSHEDPARSIPA